VMRGSSPAANVLDQFAKKSDSLILLNNTGI
jgi:hypothetical protein